PLSSPLFPYTTLFRSNFSRCGSCGYVFDNPRPTIDELVAFYSQPAKYDSWLHASKARDALWARRLKRLLPYKAAGNLLDVGTGIDRKSTRLNSSHRTI